MISDNDSKLIKTAKDLIKKRYKENKHFIASALRTTTGKIFAGVHLEAHVGRVAVCAEAVALGNAATEGDTLIETIVAVNEIGEAVSPCGMCRELISDYSPEAKVIIKRNDELVSVPVMELLPDKYHRE